MMDHDENESSQQSEVDVNQFKLQDGVESITEETSADELTLDDAPEPIVVRYDELTLAQVLAMLLRSPYETWQGVYPILTNQSPPFYQDDEPNSKNHATVATSNRDTPIASIQTNTLDASISEVPGDRIATTFRHWVGDIRIVQLGLYISAFLLTWWGTTIMVSGGVGSRTIDDEFTRAVPFVLFGMMLWALADFIANSRYIRDWWQKKDTSQRRWSGFRMIPIVLLLLGMLFILDSTDEAPDLVSAVAAPGIQLLVLATLAWLGLDALQWWQRRQQWVKVIPSDDQIETFIDQTMSQYSSASDVDSQGDESLAWYMRIHPLRVFGALIAVFLTAMVWLGTANNEMSTLVFYLWLISIALWSLILAPLDFNILHWLRHQIRQFTQSQPSQWLNNHRWSILVFLVFFLLAANFRLTHLNGVAALGTAVPPEMTSDHVEKILDSQRVLEGSRNIFFANNGGREPVQMYLMAMFSQMPGQGMNFESLKLLAVIESLLTLPILFWFGREVIGYRDKRLGVVVGLLLVGLVAVSYWHVTITRLALRIVLTPMITSLLMIYLIRALRDNNRGDFIKTGVILGFGLYTYQAVRMLPVVIVVAVFIALYFVARRWHERWRYILNLSVLVFISFMIFLPLFHYSVENPDQFWRRTTGRLLGDDIVEETLPDGSIIEREASVSERFEAFNDNVPILMSNIRNVLLMFNWKGDVGWINGFSNYPVLDPMTGAFFLLGIVAWLTWMIRHRDGVFWLVPIALFIMLLPSALSIAFPIENPSNTRTTGALPMAYLVATLPLALIVLRLFDVLPRNAARVAVSLTCGFVILGANAANTSIYFNDFRDLYVASSLPYDEAGHVLQGFAISDGAYGNAFMIAYPFWWDHRALAIESGRPDWNNGILSVADVPQYLLDAYSRQNEYKFDPERDILFFFNKDDGETRTQLREWFPQGREIIYPTYHENDEFSLYRVPVLGEAVFLDFVTRQINQQDDDGVG